jgi:hypothetical protein
MPGFLIRVNDPGCLRDKNKYSDRIPLLLSLMSFHLHKMKRRAAVVGLYFEMRQVDYY